MESANNRTTRLAHIDLLKSLAIWFVLLYHGTLYANVVYPNMPTQYVLRFFSRTILSTCVPLFFFASGYLLLKRPLNLKKHSFRTLRLAAVTCFWILFLLAVLQPYFGEYHNWAELRQSVWELRGGWNNQLWYMGVLIGIYLLLPLLKRTFDADRMSFYWFAAAAAFLVFGSSLVDLTVTVFDIVVKKEFFLFQNNLPVFRLMNPFGGTAGLGIAYFCLGGVACSLEERLLKIPALWRNLAAVTGLLVCCGTLGMLGWRFSLYLGVLWDVVWYGYVTVFTAGNTLCLYVLSLNLNREVPLLRVISANTLGIYLVHDLIHKLISPMVVTIEGASTLPGTVIYCTALLGLTLGICLVLKKIPLVKHLL